MRPLHTQRLTMRVLDEADEAFYRALYTDAQVMRHIGPPMTAGQAGAAFAKTCRLNREPVFRYRLWVMSRNEDRTDIGMLGLRRVDHSAEVVPAPATPAEGDPMTATDVLAAAIRAAEDIPAEIGAMLLPLAQGRGYAAEAIRALVDYAFEATDATRLFTRHRREHALAAGLMGKLGFDTVPDPDAAHCRWALSRAQWVSAAPHRASLHCPAAFP